MTKPGRKTLAASNSFTPSELRVLEEMLRATNLRQALSPVIARSDAAKSLARKIVSMKARVEHVKKHNAELGKEHTE